MKNIVIFSALFAQLCFAQIPRYPIGSTTGGGGTPGGSSGQIQYNNAGAFGGLTVGTGLEVSGSTVQINRAVTPVKVGCDGAGAPSIPVAALTEGDKCVNNTNGKIYFCLMSDGDGCQELIPVPGAPTDGKYVLTESHADLPDAVSLGDLNDNSIVAVDVVDGEATPRAAVAGDFPTLNQNTTGQSDTTLAFAANPDDCTGDNAVATAIAANGNFTCARDGESWVSGQFSAAQIDGLDATGKEILPAPGANKVYQLNRCTFRLNHGGTTYAGGGNISLYYGTTEDAGKVLTWDGVTPNASFVNSPATAFLRAQIVGHGVSAVANSTNQAIWAFAAADFTTGNGTMDFICWYKTETWS